MISVSWAGRPVVFCIDHVAPVAIDYPFVVPLKRGQGEAGLRLPVYVEFEANSFLARQID